MSQRYISCGRIRLTALPLNAQQRLSEDRFLNATPANVPAGGELLLRRKDFQLRLANDRGRRSESTALIDRMYAWRGYKRSSQDNAALLARQITLQTCNGEDVFGTLTVRYDSDLGLAADALYRSELDAYREAGARVAELTRLAVDPALGSKQVLGALFHGNYSGSCGLYFC
jgi:hypothetical protein